MICHSYVESICLDLQLIVVNFIPTNFLWEEGWSCDIWTDVSTLQPYHTVANTLLAPVSHPDIMRSIISWFSPHARQDNIGSSCLVGIDPRRRLWTLQFLVWVQYLIGKCLIYIRIAGSHRPYKVFFFLLPFYPNVFKVDLFCCVFICFFSIAG